MSVVKKCWLTPLVAVMGMTAELLVTDERLDQYANAEN